MKEAHIFFEGVTEVVFYRRIFDKYLNNISKKTKNLKTGTNINKQIASHLYNYLSCKSNKDKELYVYAFIDREGPRTSSPQVNADEIKKQLRNTDLSAKVIDNIKKIESIEAVCMIESWFFYDIDSILKYLKAPISNSIIKKYNNPERLNSKDLGELFKKYKRVYIKGEKSFLSMLNIEIIYGRCVELREGIDNIIKDMK